MFHVWSSYLIICSFLIGLIGNVGLATTVWANPDLTTFESHIKNKQFSEALIELQTLRQNKAYTNSPDVIYNLGLAEWHLNQFGPAIANFRLAQNLEPFSFKKIKTLNWAFKQMEDNQRIYVRKEPLVSKASQYLTTPVLFVLSLLFLASMTVAAMRLSEGNIIKKNRFKLSIILGFLSLIFFSLSLLSYQQQTKTFATQILDEEVTVFAGPSTKSASIGSLSTGDAVEVLKKTENWWKIGTSDIPSGWVKAAALQVHSPLD